MNVFTVVENHRKSHSQAYILSCKTEAYGQSVLPDRSVLIGHKLMENAKFKCDILSPFQTMCS